MKLTWMGAEDSNSQEESFVSFEWLFFRWDAQLILMQCDMTR